MDDSERSADSTIGASADASAEGAPLEKTTSIGVDETIHRPGAVKINLAGAFITEDAGSEAPVAADNDAAGIHDKRDIRLPHHTGVVSHVAVDVLLPVC